MSSRANRVKDGSLDGDDYDSKEVVARQMPKTTKPGHRVAALGEVSDDDDNYHRASDEGASQGVPGAETQRQLPHFKFRPSKRLELDAKKFDDIHEDDQAVKYLLNQYEKECGEVEKEGCSLQMEAVKVLKPRVRHVDTLDERNVEIDKSRGATFLEIAQHEIAHNMKRKQEIDMPLLEDGMPMDEI